MNEGGGGTWVGELRRWLYEHNINSPGIRKKNRQAAWKTLEVVVWATSEICQLVVVVERDNDKTNVDQSTPTSSSTTIIIIASLLPTVRAPRIYTHFSLYN